MLIGHINLARDVDDSGEYFVALIDALQRAGVQQRVLVRSAVLADRVAAIGDVDTGPLVRSPVMACCLMPPVDVVHAHEPGAGKTGLLLTLTRSIPYVLTHRGAPATRGGPLLQSIYRRASAIFCQDDGDAALTHHWLPGLAIVIVPDVERHGSAAGHLRVYQNSQRMPIAGNNGIQ
jgi:hypothetical protein